MNLVAVYGGLEGFVLICDELGIVQQEDVGEGGAEKGTVNLYALPLQGRMTLELGRGEVYLFAAWAEQLHLTDPRQIGEAYGQQVLMIAIDPRTRSIGATLVLLVLHLTHARNHHHSLNSGSGENVPRVDHAVYIVRCVLQLCLVNFSYL